ncbi:hypothetical protein [Arthrobacter sp. ov118]|nr:hypothetical protein [Arthrobacter sp. ov118]SFT95053.1 hypothetical protein SAMN04487915_10662 [Arthrobacter sp. ov118]
MAQHSQTRATPGAVSSGFGSWSKGRKIYLAVGILACLAGVLMIAFSL